MGQIQDQFVAYVSHLQVAQVEEAPSTPLAARFSRAMAIDAGSRSSPSTYTPG